MMQHAITGKWLLDVNDYINICAEREIEPEKPFKGSLNVRFGRERHEKSAIIAKEIGCSRALFLNPLIEQIEAVNTESCYNGRH